MSASEKRYPITSEGSEETLSGIFYAESGIMDFKFFGDHVTDADIPSGIEYEVVESHEEEGVTVIDQARLLSLSLRPDQ